jgi:pyruvate/2-oxoglutarate dehydrogenase complex dihydrolipoamide dehydrogenase (E3) component
MPTAFDAIVIGGGQSGPSLAERFAKEGMEVAMIERKHFGGTCVNYGCMPTKTLVASAYAAHIARRASDYGVEIKGPITVDMKKVKARKDAIVEKARNGLTRWMENTKNVTVFRGHARFTGPHDVSVNGEALTAPRIVINTGGRALVPAIPGLDDVPYLTNTSIMELDYVPEHLIVAGGSYIGLEFAQAYKRFGAKVTVIELADRLIPREDPDISDAVRDILAEEGLVIRLGAKILSVKRHGNGVAVNYEMGGTEEQVAGSHLLLAIGRRPNTDDLGLDKAGIKTDAKGFIAVDEQCRTNVEGVWAVGDANGRGAFTHTSWSEFEIVAANLFDNDPRKISDRIPCYGLFIDPPLGRAGMTDAEVKAKGIKALSAKMNMASVGRAKERAETLGFMKVSVDAETKRILGAAILGVGGDEVIHCFLDVMAADVPYTVMARTMHIHPTVAEYLPTLLQELQPMA